MALPQSLNVHVMNTEHCCDYGTCREHNSDSGSGGQWMLSESAIDSSKLKPLPSLSALFLSLSLPAVWFYHSLILAILAPMKSLHVQPMRAL